MNGKRQYEKCRDFTTKQIKYIVSSPVCDWLGINCLACCDNVGRMLSDRSISSSCLAVIKKKHNEKTSHAGLKSIK